MDIVLEVIPKLPYALDEISTNVEAQFSISRDALVLILLEPLAESAVESLIARRFIIAEECSEELGIILLQHALIIASEGLPLRITKELHTMSLSEMHGVKLATQSGHSCRRPACRHNDILLVICHQGMKLIWPAQTRRFISDASLVERLLQSGKAYTLCSFFCVFCPLCLSKNTIFAHQ